jgi:hypothetical protein
MSEVPRTAIRAVLEGCGLAVTTRLLGAQTERVAPTYGVVLRVGKEIGPPRQPEGILGEEAPADPCPFSDPSVLGVQALRSRFNRPCPSRAGRHCAVAPGSDDGVASGRCPMRLWGTLAAVQLTDAPRPTAGPLMPVAQTRCWTGPRGHMQPCQLIEWH